MTEDDILELENELESALESINLYNLQSIKLLKDYDINLSKLQTKIKELEDENNKLKTEIVRLRTSLKNYFTAAEFNNVEKMMEESPEFFLGLGKIVTERIKQNIHKISNTQDLIDQINNSILSQTEDIQKEGK